MLPLVAAGIAAGTQALIGGVSALTSGRKKRERELEEFAKNSPLYKGSKSIDDYYSEASQRYKESPYQSQQYQEAMKGSQRMTSTGLGALQDRRSGLAGVSRMVGLGNDAMGKAGVAAEQQRNQRFGQLGQASQMKTAEDYRKFDINVNTPYQRNLQLKQMKAQAANERFNAGLSMIGGAASNFTSAMMPQSTEATAESVAAKAARVAKREAAKAAKNNAAQ
jgi:hypothetical protein